MVVFRIKIAADAKNATAATEKVKKSLTGVKTKADTARVSIGRMFSTFLAIAAIRRSVRLIADFEQSLSTIKAVTGAATQQMEQLTQAALRLGETTRFTATEAADGLVLLSRAGFDANEALLAVGNTLQLAQAGGLQLTAATEITANTLRAFGIAATDTARVVDVLAKTSNSANTTVTQLGQALKFVAPIARGLNVPLEETSAVLGVLADSGQKASIGGTGLRRVMASLESPTAKAQRTLKTLGLTSKDVQISSVGLTGALRNLAATGASVEEIFQIFGRRSGTAAAVLLANVSKVSALDLALQNAGGTAQKMADIMDDNLNGALFRSRSAIQAFGLALGQSGLSSVLVGILEAVAAAFRALASISGVVLAALAGLAIIISASLIPTILVLIAKIGVLNTAMLATPFGLALGAVAFLAGGALALAGSYNKLHKEIALNNKELEKDAALSSQGAQLQSLRKEADLLSRQITAQGGNASDSQVARLKKLEDAETALTASLRARNKAQQETRAAQEQTVPSVENTIASLKRQSDALLNVTQKQKDEAAASKVLLKLRQQKVVVSAAEEKAIKTQVKQLQADKRRSAILNQINGALTRARQKQSDLNDMLKKGSINAGQFNALMLKVQNTLDGLDSDPVAKMLKDLQDTNNQLILETNLHGDELTFAKFLLAISAKKIRLTIEQRKAIEDLIKSNSKLTAEKEKQEKLRNAGPKKADKAKEDPSIARRASLLKEISVTERLAQRRRDLIALAQDPSNNQNLADINASLEQIDAKALSTSTNLGDGFTRAFNGIKAEANDFASVAEAAVNAVADDITNTLSKALIDGAFTWKEFTKSVLDDITKIITRLLVMQAISAVLGGSASPGLPGVDSKAPFFAGPRAGGGPVQPNRSFLVGEKGPELFTPSTAGNITPNGAPAPGAAAAVNVQVVNVDDPSMVPQAINDGSSDDAIINVLSRNRDKVKGIL